MAEEKPKTDDKKSPGVASGRSDDLCGDKKGHPSVAAARIAGLCTIVAALIAASPTIIAKLDKAANDRASSSPEDGPASVRPREGVPVDPQALYVGPAHSQPIGESPTGYVAPQPYPPGTTAEPSPMVLPFQQKVFTPAEVFYCPICGGAYSSAGPRDGVRCLKCGNKVNLQSDAAWTVFRCNACNNLLKTAFKEPRSGLLRLPTTFPYDCPSCKKHDWFTFPTK